MLKELKIRIGHVAISFEGEMLNTGNQAPAAYRPFIWQGSPDVSLHLHRGCFDKAPGEKIFECPPIWSLYRQNGLSVIEIFHDLPGLERTLVLSRELEKAALYFQGNAAGSLDPFFGPTMELLMVHYLALGRGTIVHGCAVAKEGTGVLFVGESGAGKSTLAGLWDQEKQAEVLSDDRTIIRKRGNDFWIYGTPWHGEGKFASPSAARLEHIFFLRHGLENSARRIEGIDSVSRLVACSFPPHWDAEGMAFTLDLFNELVAQVPCRELTFRPDRSAIDLVNLTLSR